jgi:hypothetical protein
MGEWKGKRDGVTERQRHGRMSSTFLLSFNATACRGDVKKKKKAQHTKNTEQTRRSLGL